MSHRRCRLPLTTYYVLEGLNAFAGTLFLYGVFFWTRVQFGYPDRLNLLLGAVNGLIYVAVAKYGGRLSDRLGYDRILTTGFAGAALILLTGWLPHWRWMPFAVMAVFTFSLTAAWPALEGAIATKPVGPGLADRVGLYNICWAGSAAAGFGCSGFLIVWQPNAILWGPGLIYAGLWSLTLFGPEDRTAGDLSAEGRLPLLYPVSISRKTRRHFMYLTWLGNGIGYFMISAFTALAPGITEKIGFRPEFGIWLACVFLISRAGAFLLFWKWSGWHYRLGWHLTAISLAPVAFGIVLFSGQWGVILMALLVFGFALGLSYYGSLFYSLNYGETKGEHGGLHEAILGLGILGGPLVGVAVGLLPGTAGTVETGVILTALAVTIVGCGLILEQGSKSHR